MARIAKSFISCLTTKFLVMHTAIQFESEDTFNSLHGICFRCCSRGKQLNEKKHQTFYNVSSFETSTGIKQSGQQQIHQSNKRKRLSRPLNATCSARIHETKLYSYFWFLCNFTSFHRTFDLCLDDRFKKFSSEAKKKSDKAKLLLDPAKKTLPKKFFSNLSSV